MPTTLTIATIKDTIEVLKHQKSIIKSITDDTVLAALEHMKAEFEALEDYRNNVISHLEFSVKTDTLIENRYKG